MRPGRSAAHIVRGFRISSAASGDDDHDHSQTPQMRAKSPMNRGRSTLNDLVSANCSPIFRPHNSPAISGIGKLRLQMDELSLDTAPSTRANSLARCSSLAQYASPLLSDSCPGTPCSIRSSSCKHSNSVSGDESQSDGTTSYEISLEHDFVSIANTSVIDAISEAAHVHDSESEPVPIGPVSRPPKVSATDFEPLRCLGKGAYGTVLLVKQRSTGRLFAQKQFKKASLVVHKKLVEQTKTERQILESVNRHPFVVNLYYAFQDREKLYLILEYGQGGELFTHLNTEKMFSEDTAAFYMAEMVLALSHLHDNLGVVYRDMKPENCLLDAQGHLLLTDFGLSKVAVDADSCHSMLGTVEYMAPEVISGKKYGKPVDWWSLGALGFDLMTGNPPFRGPNHVKIQENIVKQKLQLPYFLSADAKDLLIRLLRKEPTKRLGSNMPKDMATIKQHRFFRKIDWNLLAARQLEPPLQPMITDPELAENFAPEFTELSLGPLTACCDEPWSAVSGSNKDELFGGFSYVASSSLLENDGFPIRA